MRQKMVILGALTPAGRKAVAAALKAEHDVYGIDASASAHPWGNHENYRHYRFDATSADLLGPLLDAIKPDHVIDYRHGVKVHAIER
jgi:nucleoside-diphosphate-sugar epimerase